MLRKAFGAALIAACGYAVAGSAADTMMYLKAKRSLMDRAAQHYRLQAALGEPLRPGPWYNSSVQNDGGFIVTVVLPLHGTQRSSDVTVRMVRQGGLRSTLLYNLLDAGEWDVLVMQAVIGMGPGGIPQSMSLLQLEEPEALAGTLAAQDSCLTCPPQQQPAATAAGHTPLPPPPK